MNAKPVVAAVVAAVAVEYVIGPAVMGAAVLVTKDGPIDDAVEAITGIDLVTHILAVVAAVYAWRHFS